MTDATKSLIIQSKNSIRQCEVPLFRGAILNAVKDSETNTLFHNHTEGDGFRYAYPLIQYKRIGGCAAIVCFGEGTEAIGEFFAACNFHLRIGDREEDFEIDSVKANQTLIQTWDSEFRYTLRKWLPLSSDNYKEYLSLDGIVAKLQFLQRILTGNILSLCKGLDIFLEKEVTCEITDMEEPRLTTYKGVKMMSFDIAFKSNTTLPDYAGLGKGVSLGFGMVKRIEKE